MNFDKLSTESRQVLDKIKKARYRNISDTKRKIREEREDRMFLEMKVKDFEGLRPRAFVEKTVMAQEDYLNEQS